MAKTIISHNSKGFTLIEVMMAMTIFAVFITAILSSQSANVNQSMRMAEDLNLHSLAQMKINEVLLNPPVFTNATDNDAETGAFELEDFKDYKYKIEFSKTEFPNFDQLTGSDEEETQTKNDAIKKLIFDKLKKNIELMIWQVKVTVTNTTTDYNYELSSWITNKDAKLDINFAF